MVVPSFFRWRSAGWLAGRAAVEEGITNLPPVEGDDESVAPTRDLFGRRCCGRKPKEEQRWLRRSPTDRCLGGLSASGGKFLVAAWRPNEGREFLAKGPAALCWGMEGSWR